MTAAGRGMSRISIALSAALVLVLASGTAWYWAAQAERLNRELARVNAELAMDRRADEKAAIKTVYETMSTR